MSRVALVDVVRARAARDAELASARRRYEKRPKFRGAFVPLDDVALRRLLNFYDSAHDVQASIVAAGDLAFVATARRALDAGHWHATRSVGAAPRDEAEAALFRLAASFRPKKSRMAGRLRARLTICENAIRAQSFRGLLGDKEPRGKLVTAEQARAELDAELAVIRARYRPIVVTAYRKAWVRCKYARDAAFRDSTTARNRARRGASRVQR